MRRLEALAENVRADYQRWQTARQRAALLSKFTVAIVDLALMANKQQLIALSNVPSVVVVILPGGEIHPTLVGDDETGSDAACLMTRRCIRAN